MVDGNDFKVLEFNARFGDPETQALMPLIDEDLLPWLEAAADGALASMPATGPRLKKQSSVHLVMAAHGYPATPRKGDKISIEKELLEPKGDRKLFFAGVSDDGRDFSTSGGRVLGLTALGADRAEAREKAYRYIEGVKFDGAQRRSDVGK
jgi:phosphoribosylamine--glycine ligase